VRPPSHPDNRRVDVFAEGRGLVSRRILQVLEVIGRRWQVTLVVIICIFLSLVIVALTFLLVRASRRLIQFDELFEMLMDDIDVNVRHLEKTKDLPAFENVPELIDNIHMHIKNMDIISRRLREFSLRIGEIRELDEVPANGKKEKIVT